MRVRILSQKKPLFVEQQKNNNKGSQIKNIEIFNFITQILEDNKH